MDARVYLIRASLDEGDEAISDKARALFKAGGFADCFREDDLTAGKVHVGEDETDQMLYISAKSLATNLERLRKENGDKFTGLKFFLRKESNEKLAQYVVEQI